MNKISLQIIEDRVKKNVNKDKEIGVLILENGTLLFILHSADKVKPLPQAVGII